MKKVMCRCCTALAAAGLLLFAGCSKPKEPAVYTGFAQGFTGPIEVAVTVADGNITAAEVTSISDSDFTADAVNQILTQAVETGSADALDIVSGATITSNGVIEALQTAMAAAAGN